MSGVDLSKLNDNQRVIATTLDQALFVEAGAGSGKTHTLTKRVAWALSPGSGKGGAPFLDDLSQVLVITFTNAAAREIRERVRSTLRDAGMRDAALQIDSAWISTIHGMCQRILRRNALELGIDPAFGVCGTHRESELLDIAVERCVGAARRESKPGTLMAEMFEELEYRGVVTRVLSLVSCARAAVNGFDSLRLGQPAGVQGALKELLRSYEALDAAKLSVAARKAVVPSLQALRAFDELPLGARTAERAAVALESCKMPRSSKAIAELHAEAKAELAYARALVALEHVAAYGPTLLELARHTSSCYAQLKRSQSLLDNDDLISLALKAVSEDASVAARYAGRFKLVMVDEFQDTDAKQLKLISILAGADVFGTPNAEEPRQLATVGDAQQSIYRFRGADVSVFNERGTRVPAQGHVRMDVNYRSDGDVLALVDKVCGGEHGVLKGFMHLDAAVKREGFYSEKMVPRVAIEVVSNGQSRVYAQQRAEQMAKQIADRFAWYRAAGESAGNMVLLMGSTTHASLYIDALRARDFTCVVTGGSTFTKAPEVGVMLSLLRTLANPRDTQSGLFPLLSSEMFELDANDFLLLGSRKQEKLDAPTKRTIDRGIFSNEQFGTRSPSMRLRFARCLIKRAIRSLGRRSVADVCLDVVRDSGWLSRLEDRGAEGVAQEANVLAAVRYIRDLTDELGLGPARAAEEFAHWMEVSKLPPASLAGEKQDTVRIMTIHASKGLEFPVVAVAECWSNPIHDGGLWSAPCTGSTTEGDKVSVLLDPKGGVKLDGTEEAAHAGDLVSLACDVQTRNKEADAQEKARLLYVALTRAEDALVLAMNVPTTKGGISSELAAGVVDALLGGDLPPEGESSLDYGGSMPAVVNHVAVMSEGEEESELDGEPEARSVEIYRMETVRCDKVVLARSREDVFSYSSALAGKEQHVRSEQPAQPRPQLPRKEERDAQAAGEPLASDEDKATNLGSAFHMIAQTMVETRGKPDPDRVEAISRRWNLSARQRSRLGAALERWVESDLRKEALSYELMRAEAPFFSLSSGSQFGAYVEGAIDLLCTHGVACEGHALVIDYKTGDLGLSEEEVRMRHAKQAELYAKTLLAAGFSAVTCAFMAVETGVVARYES